MNLFSISDISFKPTDLNKCKNVALLAVLVPPISSSACFRFLALLDLRPCSPHYQTSPCLDTAAMVGQKAHKFVFEREISKNAKWKCWVVLPKLRKIFVIPKLDNL